MKKKVLLLTLLVGTMFSCKEPEGNDTPPEHHINLSDSNNYSLNTSIAIPVVETASATDIEICWDQVVSDIQCHDLNAQQDVHNVSMIRFRHLSHADIEERISAGNLQQSDMDGYVEFNNTDRTCASLSEMSFFGTPIDVANEYTADGGTYLVLLTEGITPGVGARMLTFIQPTDTSTNTTVSINDGCGVIDADVDLRGLERIRVPAESPWTIDWTDVTADGQGNTLSPEKVDGVFLAFYEDLGLEDIESNIFDYEILASQIWELDHSGGTTTELGDASDGTSPFNGFHSTNGLWALALICSRCPNPAPLFLTILEPVQ